VLSWRVQSQCIKTLEAGQFVGYGCTHRCDSATLAAVFPVGYADGYARCLTGHAYVLVGGLRCPVIGRVMMNHIIVALPTRLGVGPNDTVTATLLGADGAERIAAEDVASWSGTINYEAVTRLSPGIRRVICHGDGEL
jgi:alanine racemase